MGNFNNPSKKMGMAAHNRENSFKEIAGMG
jgi:hypothetical protein